MRFTLEESMAELSELAGTAGLEVAGSTYQRVLEPNPRTYIGTGKVCVSFLLEGRRLSCGGVGVFEAAKGGRWSKWRPGRSFALCVVSNSTSCV